MNSLPGALLSFTGIFLIFVSLYTTNPQAPINQSSELYTGGEILFFRKQRQSSGELFLMDANGSNTRQIGQSGSRADHYPNWSPDGEWITFESYRAGGWRVWIMKADGTQARKLLKGRHGISTYEFDPSFSADGEQVIFTSNGDIFSVNLDGTNLKNLTKTPNTYEYSPYQSPDGSKLLYVSKGEIYVMNLQTKRKVNISNSENTIEYAPFWSPDGEQILYYSDRSGSFELYLMNVDGSESRFLLDRAEMKEHNFQKTAFVDAWDNNWGATEQYKASFSPDGSKIVFSRNVGGNREIFIAGVDGKGISRITRNNAHDGFPMWRPK